MSDISGPQQPRDATSPIRGAEKTTSVSKDPDGKAAQQRQHPENQQTSTEEQSKGRDPAVSIAAQTASLGVGQQLDGTIIKRDSEGRPILETSTLTVALRPDAGLRPSDTIALKISQVGQELTGQIVQRNGSLERYPETVSLTIIKIKATVSSPINDTPSGKPAAQTYAPRARAQETLTQADDPDISALLAVKNTGSPSSLHAPPLDKNSIVNTGRPSSSASILAANVVENHDTQANKTQIPAGGITETSAGLGPVIPATTKDGTIIQLQEIDVSISRVPPQEIAVIERIVPLEANEAKTLALPAVSLSQSSDAASGLQAGVSLVKLETSRGTIIAPSDATEHLSGQSVRVSNASAASVNQSTTPEKPRETHKALWVEDKSGSLPRKINVQLLGPETAKSRQPIATAQGKPVATISNVQTLAAFIGANGPRADLRLQTSLGDISLTLPSAQRPKAGDTVVILPAGEAAAKPPATVATQSPSAPTSPPEAGILSNWPVFEEAVTALAAANPSQANALTEKSAQGGAKLTNSLLFFLKAAGRTDPASAWIGEKASASLEKVSSNILRQLKSDFRQMATIANDASGEWRSFILPFETRLGDFPLVALLVQNPRKHDQADDNQQSNSEETEEDQRFVVQVEFSVLGDIQLDGIIRQKAFDLTVRSKRDLGSALADDTKALFDQALAANGFSGTLKFEQTDAFTVDAASIASEQLMQAHS